MSDYNKQAEDFLKETGTKLKSEFIKHGKYFEDDTEERDIYEITLKKGDREFKFKFGQSLNNSGLRLFHDKEKTERTRHIGFIIPKEIREKQNAFNLKNKDKKIYFGFNHIIREWFKREHFNLSGLYWDLGEEPKPYDVLASIQKSKVGDFNNFCGNFGYDEDSKKAEKTYKAVCEEWDNIRILFSNEEIEKLQQIN